MYHARIAVVSYILSDFVAHHLPVGFDFYRPTACIVLIILVESSKKINPVDVCILQIRIATPYIQRVVGCRDVENVCKFR